MTLNKQKGNMYSWCDYTWNPIKGKCPHDCSYCYMKRFPVGDLRLDKKCLNDDLGTGNTIFVGSSCDMFAKDIPDEWIKIVLETCKQYNNKYLFQSKNTNQMTSYIMLIPNKSILGTTLESNRSYKLGNAPTIPDRVEGLIALGKSFDTMVSIEPILDFDLEWFVEIIQSIQPKFVSIGADSKNHGLPEPSSNSVKQLIKALKQFTEVKEKANLKRILN